MPLTLDSRFHVAPCDVCRNLSAERIRYYYNVLAEQDERWDIQFDDLRESASNGCITCKIVDEALCRLDEDWRDETGHFILELSIDVSPNGICILDRYKHKRTARGSETTVIKYELYRHGGKHC